MNYLGKKRKIGKKGSIFRKKVTRGVPVGAHITIADNSGAKIGKVIGVLGLRTVLRRLPAAAVGDVVVVAIQRGTPEMRRKLLTAILVRQKQPIHRVDGTRIVFEDNAAVIISADGDPKGSNIRGPIAREAAELFPRVASIASQII